MASPAQLLHRYPNDNLFATPNFDEMRDGSLQEEEFSYFDSLDSTGDSYLLDGGDYAPSWEPAGAKEAMSRRADQVVDPFLTGAGPFSTVDFTHGDAMFVPARELTPPPSSVEERPPKHWPSFGKGQSKAMAIDMQSEKGRFAQNHGQITPPMSSKSPESESATEPPGAASVSSSKRGRKPTAKAAAKKAASATAPATPAKAPARTQRKTRKAKAAPEEDVKEDDESQSEEAKAKRARFLERNRQAAFTCRQRKKQWAKNLEDQHRTLERDNQNLKLVLVSLKDEFHYLRQQVVSHTTCECSGAREYIQRSSRVLAGVEGNANGSAGANRGAADRTSVSSPPAESSSSTPALEDALRASLAQFEGPATRAKHETLDFVHEGSELDGMTL